MPSGDKHIRYIPASSARKIATELNVEHDKWMQDWPLEVANPARVSEFLRYYQEGDWSDSERFGIMQLILYSLDEHGHSQEIESHPNWDTVSKLLVQNAGLHIWSFFDIGFVDDEECGEDHPVALLLQRLYREHLKEEYPLESFA